MVVFVTCGGGVAAGGGGGSCGVDSSSNYVCGEGVYNGDNDDDGVGGFDSGGMVLIVMIMVMVFKVVTIVIDGDNDGKK